MQLVDKQDDAAVALFDFVQDGLEPFLKFAAVLRPGNQAAHVQGEDRAVLQGIRHVAPDDAQGQPFGDGRFAHAGLADQDRVVLGLPGEDADHVPDLPVAADDGVQLVLSGPLHQVGAELGQGVIGILRVFTGHLAVAPDGGQDRQEAFPADVIAGKEGFKVPVRVFQQAQEQVLHGDVLVLHPLGDLCRLVDGLVQVLRDVELPLLHRAAAHPGALVHQGGRVRRDGRYVLAHLPQHLRDQALFVTQQGAEQVGLLQLLVGALRRQGLGAAHGFDAFLRIFHFGHCSFPPFMSDCF